MKSSRITPTLTLLLTASAIEAFTIAPPQSITTTSSHGTKLSSPIKIRSSSSTTISNPRHHGSSSSLQASISSGGVIPYYQEIMERMPSKAVLDVVEKADGRPIVASGEID
eukprot:scaffold79699_cov33-Cyclotella_meneghiniana.AAC.1